MSISEGQFQQVQMAFELECNLLNKITRTCMSVDQIDKICFDGLVTFPGQLCEWDCNK